jgi:ElaB/YqjD/DUF883 family membrane-anchored ribosome-binding protein
VASTSLEYVSDRRVGGDDAELTVEKLRERVSARARSMAAAVDALTGEIREAADWRTQAARHPYWALGVAAAAGLLSAGIFRRRRDPQARILQAAADGLEGLASRLRGSGSGAPFRRPMGGAGPLIRGVVGALATHVLRHRLGRRLEAVGVRGRHRPKAGEFVNVAEAGGRCDPPEVGDEANGLSR